MFSKETYIQRRLILQQEMKSGLLVFLGNKESGMNYADNTYRFRQDSSFLYYFGLDCADLAAIIDVDEDREIVFGNELTDLLNGVFTILRSFACAFCRCRTAFCSRRSCSAPRCLTGFGSRVLLLDRLFLTPAGKGIGTVLSRMLRQLGAPVHRIRAGVVISLAVDLRVNAVGKKR